MMPKIIYLISEDWFFVSHFLPMARAARLADYEVVVATRLRKHAERIETEGCRIISLESERGSLGPVELLRSISRIFMIIRRERPDIVHCIALRMVMLGGIAARLAGAKAMVLAPTGLGRLWNDAGIVGQILRPLVRFIAARWLRNGQTRYLFENADDPREFGFAPTDSDVTLIGGAGVDPFEFPAALEPTSSPVKIAIVSRMLASKGIPEAIALVCQARGMGVPVELHLFGAPDSSNPDSLTEADLRAWSAQAGIKWHGPTNDVARVWREHHIAMLLSSYREGLPRSLVEAAASGRPIITTDNVGCREIVRNGIEGYLVPVGDMNAAAQAIKRLVEDSALRARMGAAANARFNERFTQAAVMRVITELYRSCASSN